MKHAFLLLAALVFPALCLSHISAQTPPSPSLTGKIAHITILGTKNIPADTVRAVLNLKVGDAYTPAATAKDVAAIKGMGVFNSVTEAETADHAVGVNVAYTVAENPVVTDIKFTTTAPNGKPSIPFGELFTQLKTPIGQVLNTNILVKDLDALFNHKDSYAAKQGYVIDVSSDINIDPLTGVLTIPLKEYQVKSITVNGNSRIKTLDILAQMHLKIGDIFDSNAFDESLAAIYETGNFRKIDYTRTTTESQMDIALSVVEQAPATGVFDEKQGKIIPFLYDPITVPIPVIQVSINGEPPLPFAVDTGSTAPLLLNPWAAKKLGLRVSDLEEKADNYVYKNSFVHDVAFIGLGSGENATFVTQTAQVADLGVADRSCINQHIAGIVGLGLLAKVTSRFDFAARTLTLFTKPHPPLHILDGITLPLHGGGAFTARATLAPNTYADLIVDTGSDFTQIPLPALKALHPTALTYSGLTQIEGDYVLPKMRLPEVDFGSLHVPDVVVTVMPPPTGPSLGMDILTGYRLTLDGPNGQLILEPSTQSRGYTAGRSGLDIKRSGKKWFVSRLNAKLPAQNAGLQVGDELVTVGRASIKGLSLDQIGTELSGIAGTPVQVSVRRGRQTLMFTWVPVDAFHISPSVIDGLTMTRATDHAPWIVEDVLRGCAGSLVGLQVGDKITHINGHSVADKPEESNEEAEEAKSAVFEIERAGVAKPFTVRLTAVK